MLKAMFTYVSPIFTNPAVPISDALIIHYFLYITIMFCQTHILYR